MSAAANFCIGVVQIVGVEWRLGVLEIIHWDYFDAGEGPEEKMNDIGYGGKGAESSIPVQTEKESRERGVNGYTRQMAERVFYWLKARFAYN